MFQLFRQPDIKALSTYRTLTTLQMDMHLYIKSTENLLVHKRDDKGREWGKGFVAIKYKRCAICGLAMHALIFSFILLKLKCVAYVYILTFTTMLSCILYYSKCFPTIAMATDSVGEDKTRLPLHDVQPLVSTRPHHSSHLLSESGS